MRGLPAAELDKNGELEMRALGVTDFRKPGSSAEGGSSGFARSNRYPARSDRQDCSAKDPTKPNWIWIQVAAGIEFSDHRLRLDLVLLNLKRPGQPAADTSVNDILKTTANEWVATGAYLLVSQLVKAAAPADLATAFHDASNALLSVLGLTGTAPAIRHHAKRSGDRREGHHTTRLDNQEICMSITSIIRSAAIQLITK
jgi:hypothetical protein